jgi:uncharacterized membrane protein
MKLSTLLWTAVLSLAPISELRGGIPVAVAAGMPLVGAALWCAAWNALAIPIAFLFLGTAHKLLYRWKAYAVFFDRFVERSRVKVKPMVEKYGYVGLSLFVGVPFPVTGAWTGVLGAWILGMDKKKAMLAISAGIVMAAFIVSLVVGLGISALSFFVKGM